MLLKSLKQVLTEFLLTEKHISKVEPNQQWLHISWPGTKILCIGQITYGSQIQRRFKLMKIENAFSDHEKC